ncbi:gp18 tail sheath protein [Delftia phage PhiW-14]|uniref:Gp18 tail sheath protein n=1 Tax=Delftia phage PhiW-14 TaxID=665032 RepID=C9DG17_BPW14|nr:gp18 tail sheath protein [Delftia phage PhiW-14]ACV50068.1 gp18 tail sheath protein [Delftia phage PhiW-14]
MAFYISPSVNIFESDFQSLAVVQQADYIGGSAGYTPWGPAGTPVLITGGEAELVTKFHKPDESTYLDMLTSIDFLTYSAKMWFTRVVGKNAKNATAVGEAVLINNEDDFDGSIHPGQTVIARYPGSLGNGLTLDIADAARFPTWEFAQAFEYVPGAGEYAVAVVDGSGRFSGQGRSKQRESLSVYGEVDASPTREVRSLKFAGGPATKTYAITDFKLSITDHAKGGEVPIGDLMVPFMPGESDTDVYPRIVAAMMKQPALFMPSSVGYNYMGAFAIKYDYEDLVGESVLISGSGSANALNKQTRAGDGQVSSSVIFADFTFTIAEADTSAAVSQKFVTASATSQVITNVAYDSTNDIVTYHLVAKGPQAAIPVPAERQGITMVETVVSNGSPGNDVITVFGANVLVTAQMTTAQVASAIATALAANADFSEEFEDIRVERTTIHFAHKEAGLKPVLVTPETQAGLEFTYGVSVQGQLGTLLERYEIQTTKPGDKFADGTLKNIFDSLRQSSRYVYWADRAQPFAAGTIELSGGVDDYTVSKETGIKLLDNAEALDVNYVWIAGNISEQKALVDVVETRRDVVGHLSPQFRNVVNNKGRETEAVHDWRVNQVNRDSTYLFNNDNWGLIYDKYNDKDRWIPICGGTAGLQARAALNGYPWTNFSGHQRGLYKNYKRMAWSANKGSRDTLYKVGVNSAVTFPGEGMVLYGDKMSTQRPSSFSRVNTRMAFIVAQKSLANFSRQYLFEINDPYTRNQWLNAARPFLRNMVAGRAFEDFQLICDDRNNGPDVRAENRMVGHIRIRPLYSINWIDLHFDAVRPGINFDEVELT